MGRSYGDSANFRTVLQTQYLDHLLEFDKDNGVLTCESGIIIKNILNLIVPNGWFIPVSPGTSYATLGGAIASDVHGKNHHQSGTFGDHVQSIKMMLGSGEIIETSGHGGVFPPGVNVGKIISISNGNYYVQPLPNPQKLRFVSIISNGNLESRKKSTGFAPLQENQNKINLKGFNKFSN